MKALAAALLLLAQDPVEDQLKDLVPRLGADEIEAREEALKAIVELGEAAVPHLKRLQSGQGDAEVSARLKGAVEKIERNAARARVYRPTKLITLDLKDVPLEDAVRKACAEAGVEADVPRDVAGRKVTLAAEQEPVLKVLDRLCAAEKDLVCAVAEGKLQIAREKVVPYRTAYAEGFRARVRRVNTFTANNFEAPTTTVILYLSFDAQPDLRARSAAYAGNATAKDGRGGEIAFKPASAGRQGGSSMGGGRGHVMVDDVLIHFDAEHRVENACFLKEAPAGLKSLPSLSVKTKFRFAAGTKVATCKLRRRDEDARLEGLPIRVSYMGSHLQLEHAAGRGGRLEDLIDIDSLVVVTKDGKEQKASPLHVGMGYYLFQCRVDASAEAELRATAYDDVFEREVEFQFADVPIKE